MAKKRKKGNLVQQLGIPQLILAGLILAFVGLLLVRLLGEQPRVAVDDAAAVQQESTQREHRAFIEGLAPVAQRLQLTYHVLPSVTIAQAILESDWGNSQLATRYHNLFGVKGSDPNTTQLLSTKEYQNGQWIEIHARFQVYTSDTAALEAHAKLLAQGTSWNPQQYQHVIAATDYKSAAAALQQDGYATDPTYAQKLINVIETYKLNQYDQ
ncbi:glycoside hydrolase family 73 protein [Loigolactobacillus zhaoyuanensis]|uniref:Glycoside hydrolase family 73 protein n=1 Tax=Loigolactobacillus zhaoyuanensis TaxID=2486017 RepID=A0ABW8UAS8_9LACO|nr:glycoside hydrolase family 73 protein [Loigolactobacillus zhaoyuanensis]